MEYKLPLETFAENVAKQHNQVYLYQPINREFRTYTWGEVDDKARRIAAGLLAQGFQPGDRIGILSKNCAEWFIADIAIMMAGMISVPIYFTAGESTIDYVLKHSETKAIFLGKLDSPDPANSAIPDSVMGITMSYETANASEKWENWLKRYEPLAQVAQPKADDTMTISYTSGSTGTPKGVVLSFKNFASMAHHASRVADARPGDSFFSYLPLAHVTERGLIEAMTMYTGNDVYFVESLDTFPADLVRAKPAVFISVPRLWSKFQSGVLQKMPDEKLQKLLRIPLLGRFIAWKIRKALGFTNTRLFGSGTAPISPSVLEWYNRLRVPISEGWGMTETAGLACANIPFRKDMLGTIGVPLPCCEIKLSEDDEIMVRGDAVFSEYYLAPEITAENFTDGWFHTGDVAKKLPNGAYQIIGRIKEQFKTAKGKYVAPVPIESLLSANPNLDQVCVMGSGRKQPIALVVSEGHLQPDEAMRSSLQDLLKSVNSQLEGHERLDNIVLCREAWGVENDLLTPTLKLKRNVLEQHYEKLMGASLKSGTVVWESEI